MQHRSYIIYIRHSYIFIGLLVLHRREQVIAMIGMEKIQYKLGDGSVVNITRETNELNDEYMDFDVSY